ncbi:hypothetical protein JCM8547_003877 [Rhodosporidiobolus lusitaniae]
MASLIRRLFASELRADEPAKFFLWMPPGTTYQTKRFLWKLDAFVISYGCLSYWVNITNAYVSGMKEDLGFFGNELTWFTTYFTIGTSLSIIPSNWIICYVPPHIWLPGCEFAWGILTLVMYKSNSAKMIYALRFLIGCLEGSTFVGMIYCFGSWYTKRELGKRLAIFATCAYLGSMFSGYMTSAIVATLDGRNGLEGWRWLFIIDAAITFVIAIWGFTTFPDTPMKTRAWWLSPEEKKFAVERLKVEGRGEEFDAGGLSVFKRLFTRRFALLVFAWIGWSNTLGKYVGTVFSLYLKNNPSRWSLYQINNIPTSSGGFNIAGMLLLGWLIDMTGRRYAVIVACLCTQILGTVLYLVYDIGVGGQIAALLLGALDGPTSPIIMTWANLILGGDVQRRALTIATMNATGSAVSSIVNNYGYKATDAPQMRKGIGISLGFVCFELVMVTILRYVEINDSAKLAATTEGPASGSASLDLAADDSEKQKETEVTAGAVMPVATK